MVNRTFQRFKKFFGDALKNIWDVSEEFWSTTNCSTDSLTYLEVDWIVDRISSKMASVSDAVLTSGRGLGKALYLSKEEDKN